ncbi:MAG TPA: aminotransferase class I/II-fold pyridoxal phosphate-dependent enzyme [Solirubrobacteraceae bacterium]|nr:aminotransferase class I/II-fold pyridoxal phosphate-dependent enzyme [Solirubrobacteraceae bacterium]
MSALTQYRIKANGAAELANSIEAAVASGDFSPGQRLPSVRRLAAEVGLSPVTVAAGLAELRRRGVVVTEPRRGTRIGDAPPIGSSLRPLPVPVGARDLSRGNPDPALLPNLERALAHTRIPARLYGDPAAMPELVEHAREQLRADGLPSEELCVMSGALDAIERVLQAQLRTGDRVAVESPGYAALFDVLRAHGLVMEPVEVDDRGMLPAKLQDALTRGADAVIIVPRGQNPTGAALDQARTQELRDVLDEFPQALVVEDDHLGPVAGCDLHTTLGARERWAATRSVAKALGPDLRLAILAGDPQTIARVQGRQRCGPGWVSHILQALVLRLWTDPIVTEQISHASDTYARRRLLLLERLGERSVRAHGASGLNVWVPVGDEAVAVAALLQRGWVVAPGAPYRLADDAPAIRVTTATLTEPEAERLSLDIADVLLPTGATRNG